MRTVLYQLLYTVHSSGLATVYHAHLLVKKMKNDALESDAPTLYGNIL
jgi:hypothetical protein